MKTPAEIANEHIRIGSSASRMFKALDTAGYVIVPKEPTNAICSVAITVMSAIVDQYGSCRTTDFPLVWRAIIDVIQYSATKISAAPDAKKTAAPKPWERVTS